MQRKYFKSMLYLLTALMLGGQLLATVNSACKSSCMSPKIEDIAKHRCCPQMAKKAVCPQTLSQKCSDCFENREIPEQIVEKSALSHVEPNSISELGILPVLASQYKKINSYISPPLSHSSLSISLHRFLI